MNKRWFITPVCLILLTSNAFSTTLKECVIDAIKNNPIIQERIHNYRATVQDLGVAKSEYYPKVDLLASLGYNNAGKLKKNSEKTWKHTVPDIEYGNYLLQLKVVQNLFDGFGTKYKIDYQQARILAAAYNYLEKANDIAFRMTGAYIDVLQSKELTQTARDNIKMLKNIYDKVKDLYNAGLTSNSEVQKIASILSLAKSNLIVQKNNARDAQFHFRRILGRLPDIDKMEEPIVTVALPDTLEKATSYAITHNPSLLVAKYNLQGAQILRLQHRKSYYPKIDLEFYQNFNDVEQRNPFDSPDDRFIGRIVVQYNIFNGWADKSNLQKDVSKINQEVSIRRDLKRQVIEGMDLSWDTYKMVGAQLKRLKEYKKLADKTLELYNEEYSLGRRSLLDLIAAQNEVINARRQIIKAKYTVLLAKYRILDAMGLLPQAVLGNTQEIAAKVNNFKIKNVDKIEDQLPVSSDIDNDHIPDDRDLCDNSRTGEHLQSYGCRPMPQYRFDEEIYKK